MDFLELKIPPPLVGALCALAMWGLAGLAPGWPDAPTLRALAAGALLAAGLAIDLLGLLGFRAQRTTINPLAPQRSSALVTGGIYRLTRNPMYLGMGALLLAWAVWLWAPLALLGPPAFVLYITRFQIRPEERVLQRLFGDAYTHYTRRVRRWL
ncbi:MAG: protein-S-isoprenylcysteine methyltransferase [Rubrivivax sp. SCN 71-131]|jgi:protein-S-isoprenylcysteine O-methyltransferase Ste14|nr:MAG: protein-S-isoprenylcysteine methyltransferase [Rubrivivax sp. SCN 71-131]